MKPARDIIHPRAVCAKSAVWEKPIRLNRHAQLGANTFVGRWTYFSDFASASKDARIGRFCSIAKFVEIGAIEHPLDYLSTHPFQFSRFHWKGQPEWEAIERVEFANMPGAIIGHDVWIGAKAIVTRGITIGTGAIIGAGSFVNSNVPPYAIFAGSPAKLIRYRFDPDVIARLLASRWWNRPVSELSGLPFDDIAATLDQLEAMPPTPRD